AQAIMRVSFGYPSFINEPCNSLEWIFVPKIHALPMANASNWYPYQQQLNIPAGSSNVDADFYGVFRGDVLQRANTRNSETLFFYAEDKENLSAGQVIEMPVFGLNFEDIS